MRLTLTTPASLEATDTDARTLRGVAIPYGQRGFTSAGPVTVDAGAVRVPANLRAVKLFREHGRQVPIGFALESTDGTDALRMGFRVAATADGDQALIEAAEGVRDALSVELNNVELTADGHVTAADLVAVAQVAVPAFAGAQLIAALSDDDQASVLDLATQIVGIATPADAAAAADAGTDAGTTTTTTTDRTEAAMTTTPETVTAALAPPARLNMTPTRPAMTAAQRAQRDRRVWASQLAEAMRGATDAAQVNAAIGQLNAALADVTPGNAGTADLFPRRAWLGELWSPEAPQRDIVNAIGVNDLTAMTMDGWKWETKPQVAPYAGNKAEVPTNPAKIVPASATASRIAGGWDLDRIYLDFNTGFIEAFLRAASADYVKKSQTYFLDGHGAIVGPPAVPAADGLISDATDLGAFDDLISAWQAIVTFLTTNGAAVSFIAMASDVYADFIQLKEADVPWWLRNQGTITPDGSVTLAGSVIRPDPGMAAGRMLGGDAAACSLWETGPINVQAINIPNGGIDLGLFGYWAQMVHDPAGLARADVTSTSALAAGNGRTTKKAAASS